MRISQFPVITIERVLDTGLLPGMLERAMKACVTRSLPDAWLGFVHIMEFRSMAVSDDFGAARHADTRQFCNTGSAAALFAQPKAAPEATIQI
jgi:hypothetical protein